MTDVISQIEPFAAAIRKLLKGVIYHDDSVWMQIRDYELPIRDYLGKIGLGMYLDEVGNFAYLYDMSRDENNANTLPALINRRSLSFLDTLLLVLLRERLDEHEMRNVDDTRLLMNPDDIKTMISVFMNDHPDAQKVEMSVDASIKRMSQSGFLTEKRDGTFEVRPLLRAKIDADKLEEIKNQLTNYLQQIRGGNHGESIS